MPMHITVIHRLLIFCISSTKSKFYFVKDFPFTLNSLNKTSVHRSVWDEYQIFGQMNIQIYSLPEIWDEWKSEYIWHGKNITNEYPNKIAHEKIKEFFCKWIYLPKIFECNRISDYFPKIVFDYFGHFHILCYFGPILKQFAPIITLFNHFWKQ